MKKAMLKYLLVAVLAVVGSQAAFSQYTTLNAIPMCWHTAGGVDSTIYLSQTDASQRTSPSRLYYYNASGGIVSVVGGTLYFGECANPTTDSLLVQLTAIVNLLGGPDTCLVLNTQTTQTLTSSSATYTADNYNSISVLNVSGTVTVQTGSDTATNLPASTAIDMTAERCRYLTKSVTVNATAGVALVVFIQ